jgi:HAD superfamily hydrolase (TIGR01459 family)
MAGGLKLIQGLAALADRYDGYVVDLWGVIHDGLTTYDGAVPCLAALRARGRRVVLLSNAPRRAAVAVAGLRRLGVPDDLYDAIVTSGEACFLALRDRPDAWFRALGRRVHHIGPPRDASVLDGLGLDRMDDPAQASFVLNTGPDDERSPTDPAAFDDVLRACRAAGLPMLCANPDLTVMRDGVAIVCAGALAERYRDLGGDVRSIGKPDPAIYGSVFAQLGVDPGRTLAIGDSLRTDIAGAAAAGIDALWILRGIHGLDDAEEAGRQAAAHGVCPIAAMPRLRW